MRAMMPGLCRSQRAARGSWAVRSAGSRGGEEPGTLWAEGREVQRPWGREQLPGGWTLGGCGPAPVLAGSPLSDHPAGREGL